MAEKVWPQDKCEWDVLGHDLERCIDSLTRAGAERSAAGYRQMSLEEYALSCNGQELIETYRLIRDCEETLRKIKEKL